MDDMEKVKNNECMTNDKEEKMSNDTISQESNGKSIQEEKFNTFESRLQELEKKFEKYIFSTLNETKDELKTAKDKLQEKSEEIQSIQAQKQSLDIEKQSLLNEKATLQNELSSTKQILQSTQTKLENTNQELGEIKPQLTAKIQENESLSSTLNETKDELKTAKDKLQEKSEEIQSIQAQKQSLDIEKQSLLNEKATLQNELSSTKQILQSTQTKLENTNQELGEIKPQLTAKIQENESLSQKYADTHARLLDLENQIHFKVYEQYMGLSSDFRSNFRFIKDKSLFAFIATAGTSNAISKLYSVIKINLINNKSCDDLIDLFNALLEIQMTYQENFERLTTKEGESFETSEHIKIGNGPSSGKVEKVILRGYKEGNTIYQSLVEVGVG